MPITQEEYAAIPYFERAFYMEYGGLYYHMSEMKEETEKENEEKEENYDESK